MIRVVTLACLATLFAFAMQTSATANFVLGFDMDPSTPEVIDPNRTVAPGGVPFDIDVLFEFTGTDQFPAAFSLDVTYDPAHVNVVGATFTGNPPRQSGFGQQTMAGGDVSMPAMGEFGIRFNTVGPFDADGGIQFLSPSSFVLGTLTLQGINTTTQDTMTTLLGFSGFGGLLADPGFTVSTGSVGPNTLVVTAIPEPTTAWACLMVGSIGIAARRRRSVNA